MGNDSTWVASLSVVIEAHLVGCAPLEQAAVEELMDEWFPARIHVVVAVVPQIPNV